MSGYEREHRNVLKHCLKNESDGADVIEMVWKVVPRVYTPGTGKARLQTAERHTDSDWFGVLCSLGL